MFPGSDHHHRLAPDLRLKSMFDDGVYETLEFPAVPSDPLKFRDERKYVDRLKGGGAQKADDQQDAIHAGFGTLDQLPIVIAVQDIGFHRRLAGNSRRRSHYHRHAFCGYQEMPLRVGLRRGPHPGRHPVIDADAAHDGHGAGSAPP